MTEGEISRHLCNSYYCSKQFAIKIYPKRVTLGDYVHKRSLPDKL